MTAPTLPETLAALAEQVPERVRLTPGWLPAKNSYVDVRVGGKWEYVYRIGGTAHEPTDWEMDGRGPRNLEYALREVVDAPAHRRPGGVAGWGLRGG